jgi:glyoxylase-like metal-dependent hydrolase (beta-lactamase superfamily II)
MKIFVPIVIFCGVSLFQAALVAASAPAAPAPSAEQLAPGVHLLRGAILPNRGPDGNTVIFDAPEGLVVVDTGRHAWHSEAILAYAAARGRPIAAIVNTHWHLDHSSGNGRLKAAHPGARVHTTRAVDRVLAAEGFLARNLEAARGMLDDSDLGDVQREEVEIFIATMQEKDTLRPDVMIERSGELKLAGKTFDVRVTDRAVTDADVWLIDTASGVAVIGDLVTFPVPFFETACPVQWRSALDEVLSAPLERAVPGHGEPMTPKQVGLYREAFSAFIDCVNTDAEANACAMVWADGIASFTGSDGRKRDAVLRNAGYYVGMLRENGGKSADCLAR